MQDPVTMSLEEALIELGKNDMALVREDRKWVIVTYDDLRSMYKWLYNDDWSDWPEAVSAALGYIVKKRVSE